MFNVSCMWHKIQCDEEFYMIENLENFLIFRLKPGREFRHSETGSQHIMCVSYSV